MIVFLQFLGELKRILTSLVEVASLLQTVNAEEKEESDMETDGIYILNITDKIETNNQSFVEQHNN